MEKATNIGKREGAPLSPSSWTLVLAAAAAVRTRLVKSVPSQEPSQVNAVGGERVYINGSLRIFVSYVRCLREGNGE